MATPSHLAMLGKRVEDRVTGAIGLVTSVKESISGSIQVSIQAKSPDGSIIPEAMYCDIHMIVELDAGLSADVTKPTNPTTIPIGSKVRDITGFDGIATNKSTYLNGCEFFWVEGIKVDKKTKPTLEWVNAERLTVVDAPVVKVESKPTEAGVKTGGPNTKTMKRQSAPRC